MPIRVGVCDVDDAREEHQGDTGNPQDRYPGEPCSASCGHHMHVIETIAWNEVISKRLTMFRDMVSLPSAGASFRLLSGAGDAANGINLFYLAL